MAWEDTVSDEISDIFRGLSVFDVWDLIDGGYDVHDASSTRRDRQRASRHAAEARNGYEARQRLLDEQHAALIASVVQARVDGRTYAQIAHAVGRSIGWVHGVVAAAARGVTPGRKGRRRLS